MLFFVCALYAEAKPIIKEFSLKLLSNEAPFKIYRNDSIVLVITGVGIIACSAAVAFVFAHFPEKDSIWINVGVAGGHFPIGSLYLANKISRVTALKSHYPNFPFNLPCETKSLITVDHPEKNPKSDTLYDMEAFGFYEVARRFSTTEKIHSIKIISDSDGSFLDKETITTLIENHIKTIHQISHVSTHLY